MTPQQNIKQCDVVYTLMQFKYSIILATYISLLLKHMMVSKRQHYGDTQIDILIVETSSEHLPGRGGRWSG